MSKKHLPGAAVHVPIGCSVAFNDAPRTAWTMCCMSPMRAAGQPVDPGDHQHVASRSAARTLLGRRRLVKNPEKRSPHRVCHRASSLIVSSAIDENIDAAEVAECRGYGGLDGSIIPGVCHVSLQTAIRGTRDFGGGRLKCSAIPCNQGDIYALLGKLPRDSLADAAVAASDDGDLILSSKSKGSSPPSAVASGGFRGHETYRMGASGSLTP
jgi:hypothetical protein